MKTYLLIAYSDIAKALAEQLEKKGARVIVATRRPPSNSRFECHSIDISDESSFEALFSKIDFDDLCVINSMGVLHDDSHRPEKSLKQLDADWFRYSMEVNCLSSAFCLKHLSNNMRRGSQVNYIAFSARVSSISDNRLGGWLSYRCSKAALNMLLKTTAIEWRMKYPGSCIIGYHPGTVDSRLSKPFQGQVKRLFSPAEAASYLLALEEKLSSEMSGDLYDWQHLCIHP